MDNEKREYNTATKHWLAQAEFLSLNAGLGYIDVIIDQAGSDKPVVDALKQLSPTARYGLLFEETPEEGMVNDSPLLVRLFWSEWQHRALITEIMHYFANTPRLILLISPLVFDELKNHLCHLTQFRWGEQSGILRFYDTRIFPVLFSHVLSEEQQFAFTRIAFYWGWQDRDVSQVWKQGKLGPESQLLPAPEVINLNDEQIEIIGCLSDAEMLSREHQKAGVTPECNFQNFFKVALVASQQGFLGDLKDYIKEYQEKPFQL